MDAGGHLEQVANLLGMRMWRRLTVIMCGLCDQRSPTHNI